MGLFSPKVPNTISDKTMRGLRRRAAAAEPFDLLSKKQIARRKAASANYRKRRAN